MGIKNKLECFSRKMSFTPGYTKGVVLAPERLQSFSFLGPGLRLVRRADYRQGVAEDRNAPRSSYPANGVCLGR